MAANLTGAPPEPRISLRQVAVTRAGAAGDWNVEWEVENTGNGPLQIIAARLPHGQFKAGELRFEPPLASAPGQPNRFQVPVHCNEPTGLVTENAFVIFQALWSGEPWRIFARLRVTVTGDGRPVTETESITTHQIGFSGVSE